MGKASNFKIENGVLLKYRGQGGYVVIPEGVTSIGRCAFRSYTEVTGRTIPEGMIRPS